MLRHLTRLASVVRPPATVSATPLPVTSLPGLPWTVPSSSSLLISSSRLLSTRVLTPSLTTTPFQRWTPSTSVDSPASSFDSESVSILAAFPNLQLAESRRYAKRFKGSSARKGRPWKDRTMRHKEWWVRRNTRFYDHDSSLTPESKDLVQDILREDYQGAAATAAGEEEEDVEGVDSATLSTSVSSPLKDAPWEPQPWSNEGIGTRRCGVLALKIGVVPQWLKDGTRVTCTMFQILDCHVINYTSPEEWDRQFSYHKYHRIAGRVLRGLQEKRGIFGVQTVGALSCDPQRFSKEYTGLFTNAGVLPKRKLTRYFVTPNAAVKPGTELTAKHFRVGDNVIVEGRTIGHGFEGVMIRWGFSGGPSDKRGSTKFHRKPGNIGYGREHKNVNRGKKLPGHMGNEWRAAFNLKILRINTKYNVIYLRGTCPGPPHAVMRLFDSTHHDQVTRTTPTDHPPLPTHIEGVTSGGGGGQPDENGDLFGDEIFDFSKPSISYAAASK